MSKESLALMDEILLGIPSRSTRLSFPLKCAAFAAAARGFPQGWIAKALNISPSAVSYIAGAQKYQDRRYQDVIGEYHKLGHAEFCEHYLTEEILARFQDIRMRVQTGEEIKARQGPDPKAAKYADRPFALTRLDGSSVTLIVSFRPTNHDIDRRDGAELPAGWAWRELTSLEVQHHRYLEINAEWSRRRDRGSATALDGAFIDHGLDPPLMETKQIIAMEIPFRWRK